MLELNQQSPCIEAPEEVWRRIEESLGIHEPAPKVRRRIASNILVHLSPAELALPVIRPAKLRKAVLEITGDATSLLRHFDFLDPDKEEEDDEDEGSWARAFVIVDLLSGKDREVLQRALKKLTHEGEIYLRSLPPDRGGRPPNPILPQLIHTLATTYKIITNENPILTYDWRYPDYPYSSAFFNFVEIIILEFAPNLYKSDQSLGKAIQRTLKIWRSN